jgi:exopolysaccharide biosynthesis polyprenyl glycosylphosphotransferase
VLLHRLAFEDPGYNSCTNDISYSVESPARLNPRPVSAALLVLDLASCMVLSWALHAYGASPRAATHVEIAIWLALPALLWCAAAYATGLYAGARLVAGRSQILPVLATSCLAVAPWIIAADAETNSAIPFTSVAALAVCQLAVVAATRGIWAFVLRAALRRGYCLERVIVLAGSLSAARVLSAELEQRSGGRLRVAANASIPRVHDEGSLLWLESTIRSLGIDQILIASDGRDSNLDHETVVGLARAGADITVLSPNGKPLRFRVQTADVPPLHAPPAPLSAWQAGCKRLFDIVVASAALLILSPVLLILAALVRLDSPGPALFRQRRQGLNGRPFEMFKFRTMYQHMTDAACVVQTARNDARVTRFGRLLRTTSFDELPQLLNVLRGDMSVVGPRPHALGMTVAGQPVATALQGYEARHRMKPGITGWAQVNGSRGEVTGARALRRRVALDCSYIENWSMRLDAWILLRTLALIFRDKHAF